MSTDLPALASGTQPLPLSYAVAGVVVLLLVALPRRFTWLLEAPHRGLAVAFLTFMGLALLQGATFIQMRPLMYYKGTLIYTAIALVTGGVGLLAARPAWWRLIPRRGVPSPVPAATLWAALFAVGTVALALPTIYEFGGIYVGAAGFMAIALVAAWQAYRRGELRHAAAILGVAVLVYRVWNPDVKNFAVQPFPPIVPYVPQLQGVAVTLLAALALYAGAPRDVSRRHFILAGGVGLAIALLGAHLPASVFLGPCLLLCPVALAAHRWPRLGPVLALLAPPALSFFLEFDLVRMGPVLCVLAFLPLWATVRRDGPLLERAIVVVTFLWLCLWTLLGCRLAGLDFNYFFRWLPAGSPVEDTWAWNSLLTTALYMSVPLVGLFLARQAAPGQLEPALPLAWQLMRLKLALVLAFIVGYAVQVSAAPPFITADVIMEAGVWVVALVFSIGLPLGAAAEGLYPKRPSDPASGPA